VFVDLPLQLSLPLPPFASVLVVRVGGVLIRVRVLDATLLAHHLVRQALLSLRRRLRPERVVDHFGGRSRAGELARFVELCWVERCVTNDIETNSETTRVCMGDSREE